MSSLSGFIFESGGDERSVNKGGFYVFRECLPLQEIGILRCRFSRKIRKIVLKRNNGKNYDKNIKGEMMSLLKNNDKRRTRLIEVLKFNNHT